MQIFVCVKQVLDWNRSAKDFHIDPNTNEAKVAFARYTIDQFDEIAVEVALKLRGGSGGTIRALSVGPESAEDMLKHVLSMKVDAATLVAAPNRVDTATLLCAAIRKKGNADVVLCGRVSSDNGTAATGPRLAEMLGLPCITNVVAIAGQHMSWNVTRESATGYAELLLTTPFVATVTNAKNNVPRMPTMKDKMWAFRQQVEILQCAELGGDASSLETSAPLQVLHRFVPVSTRGGRKLEGDPQQQARALAEYVRKFVPPSA